MRNFRTILSLVLVTILLGGASSCKKDEVARTSTYTIGDNLSSGYTAVIVYSEPEDDDDDTHTMVTITLSGTVSGMDYAMHIHSGSLVGGYGGVVHDLGEMTASGSTATKTVTVNSSYDALVAYDGMFAAHDASDLTVIVAAGEVGPQ